MVEVYIVSKNIYVSKVNTSDKRIYLNGNQIDVDPLLNLFYISLGSEIKGCREPPREWRVPRAARAHGASGSR